MKFASIQPHFTATRNACKACAPLGACWAFCGIQGAVPFLHGSQGCSTYIRRYMIGHFREPIDIASSNFSEASAIFGGNENFQVGLKNVLEGYQPTLIGVATTCLAETIGDDMNLLRHEFLSENPEFDTPIVCVSTPSYSGTQAEGYQAAVYRIVETLAEGGPRVPNQINILPGMFSPADIRYLKRIAMEYGLSPVITPDISHRLDGGSWMQYQRIPAGGTPVEQIRSMGRSIATVSFINPVDDKSSSGCYLREHFDVPACACDWPIGIDATDAFLEKLSLHSGRPCPEEQQRQRSCLIDAYIDGHKYLSGVKAVLYGEEEWVVALARFCREIGIVPMICASGGDSGLMRRDLPGQIATDSPVLMPDADFSEIEAEIERCKPDILIGHSKGYSVARRQGIPLVRVGFPIQDRIGAGRLRHIGYEGTQQLFDRIVNALIATNQTDSPVGYLTM